MKNDFLRDADTSYRTISDDVSLTILKCLVLLIIILIAIIIIVMTVLHVDIDRSRYLENYHI